MIEFSDIGKKGVIEELAPIFKKLEEVKDQLGHEAWQEIRMRLVAGHTDAEMSRYFMGKQRDMAAGYLGMSRKDYEKFLENPSYKPKKKKFKTGEQIVKEQLGLD